MERSIPVFVLPECEQELTDTLDGKLLRCVCGSSLFRVETYIIPKTKKGGVSFHCAVCGLQNGGVEDKLSNHLTQRLSEMEDLRKSLKEEG